MQKLRHGYLYRWVCVRTRGCLCGTCFKYIFSFSSLLFSAVHVFLDKISFWFLLNILNFNLTSPMPYLCFRLTHVKIFCSYVRRAWRWHQLARHNPVADLLPMLLQEGLILIDQLVKGLPRSSLVSGLTFNFSFFNFELLLLVFIYFRDTSDANL